MHNVVGTRAVRTRLAGELNLEDTSSAVSRVRRGSSALNVDRAALGLAGVVHEDGAVVLLAFVSVKPRVLFLPENGDRVRSKSTQPEYTCRLR